MYPAENGIRVAETCMYSYIALSIWMYNKGLREPMSRAEFLAFRSYKFLTTVRHREAM